MPLIIYHPAARALRRGYSALYNFTTLQAPICRSSTWARQLAAENPAPPPTPRDADRAKPIFPWTSAGIDAQIANTLVLSGFASPTEIQRLASKQILRPSPATLIAAETGAGKTLAYLAPLLTQIRAAEKNGVPRRPRRPRALVLAPTRELVEQVRAVAVDAGRGAATVRAFTGGPLRMKQQRILAAGPADILVATPAALARLRRDRAVFMSNVRHVVLDEADVLLRPGGGFDEPVDALLESMRATADRENAEIRYAFAAASVPRSLRARLAEWLGEDLAMAESDALHKAPSGERIQSRFVRVNGGEDKKFEMAARIVEEVLKGDQHARVMIFCDSHGRREKAAEVVRGKLGEDVVHISGGRERDMEERTHAWNAFRDVRGKEIPEDGVRVAVCAQSYGRGIDHTGVRAVVLVDVPMTGSEYMHRVGRVRGKGKVFTLVSRRERGMAAALFLATIRGERVAGVTAQSAREMFPGGVPKNLAGGDIARIKNARRKGWAVWSEAEDDGSRKRRRRSGGR